MKLGKYIQVSNISVR